MPKNPILNFRQFTGVFEDDVSTASINETGKSVDIIIQVFFEIYGSVATRIGGYKEAVKDLQAIADSSSDKRGNLMVSTIQKISELALKKNPDYKEAMDLYLKSAKELKSAYDKIISEDKSQTIGISKRIKDTIISYLQYLISNVKNTKLPEEKKEEAKNESEYYSEFLLEKKDLYTKERISIIKRILPLKSKAQDLSLKSLFPEVKIRAKNAFKKYEAIVKILQDDSFFDSKKKAERFKEIEDSNFKVIEIENDLNSLLSSTIVKYGIRKEINDLVKKSIESLTAANIKVKESDDRIAKKIEIKKEEEKESEPKKEESGGEKEYKEINSGDKNEEKLKPIQKTINEILPEEFKIKDDGVYGSGTKKALERIIPLLKITKSIPEDFKLDPNKITPELQKAMDEYIKKLPELKKQLF